MTEFTICSRCTGLASEHIYLRFKVKDGCEKDVYYKNMAIHIRYQFIKSLKQAFILEELPDYTPVNPLPLKPFLHVFHTPAQCSKLENSNKV